MLEREETKADNYRIPLWESIICAEQQSTLRVSFKPPKPSPAQQCLYELELDEEPQFCSANEANRVLDLEGNLIRKEMGEGRGDKAGQECG